MMTRARAIVSNEWLLSTAVAVLCFSVYLTTMCRTVSFIDAGELATVASLLGIAHPTGYPLFTLVAHCALWVPLGGEEILKLNVFSSVVVAVAVGVFFNLLLVLARLADSRKRKRHAPLPREKFFLLFAASIASLVFGFSATVWGQSVAVEVYGLHLLLVLLTTMFFLMGIEEDAGERPEVSRYLIAAAFLLGLSFTNHLTTLLIVPGLAYLYVRSYGISRQSILGALKLLPFFSLGLTPYLYLPIRAGVHPPLNWGYPAEAGRFFWHVSGKQYRTWMFSSFDSAEKQLYYFYDHFSSEFNWLVIVVLLYGVWKSFRSERMIFWFLVVALIGCISYSINYDIHDIDSYFLLAYIVAGVFVFFGTLGLLHFLSGSQSTRSLALASLLLLALPVAQLISNHKEVSEADNYLVADYVHNIFANTEKDAVILSYQWDYFVAPSLYFQLVRKERPDLVVIDKELLRRSWYLIHLKHRYPWLIDRSKAEVDSFLGELYKFEHDLPYDSRLIEERFVGMINSFVERSMENRQVYVGPEIEPEFGQKFVRIPDGLLFRLSYVVDNTGLRPASIEYRTSSFGSRLTRGLRSLYAKMLTANGSRFLAKNQLSDASVCVENALLVDPTFGPARAIKEQLLQSQRQGRE
ncbi:MAG: DUF2723 domain-containing protein [Ignavibacteria bacterium]|nr:DUF2723 domain-containing protein [Ignavibacteria bacterium]